MVRGEGDRDVGRDARNLDRPLALREQVEQFDPVAVGQRLADLREGVVGLVLGSYGARPRPRRWQGVCLAEVEWTVVVRPGP